ncbi:MAG: glutathione-disulfide reductase [Spongiibacteraceae bacterium]
MSTLSTDFDYDLFVIGAGSGGVRASRMAASYGARVAVAEDTYMGGTCVNVGCVPKKLLVYAAQFHESFRDSAGFGWQVSPPGFDWPTLLANKNREITRLNGIYERLLDGSGVKIFSGHAQLIDPNTISVNGERVTAKHILLATGGWPSVPEFAGSKLAITSNEMFFLDRLPQRIVIVGGGYIAVEFAGIMHGLGVETHLVYRGELFLKTFDRELREHLAEEMRSKGVHIHFNRDVVSIEKSSDGLLTTLKQGDAIKSDIVMYATGRKPRLDNLGLENTGVQLTKSGHIDVSAQFQTAEPSIYSIGDAIGGIELTPVALAQGMAVAKTLFCQQPSTVDLCDVPTAIFSQPTFAGVGHSEESAREKFEEVAVFTSRFTPLKHTLSGNTEKVLMKLVVDQKTDRVIGVHMLGEEAAEIIQGLAVAVKAGATKADFDATLGIHPTAAEEFVTMRTRTR